jgi:uncharacterized protein YbjT (DUF2867 family)
VEVVAGDLAVPQTIDFAMQGVAAVVLVSPAVAAQGSTSSTAPSAPACGTS